MSSQAVGNSLYALGRMGLRYDSLLEKGRVALEIAVRQSLQLAHDQDLMQTAQGLALLRVPWSALSAQTRHGLSMAIFTRAKTWLQRGSFDCVVEYSTLLRSLGRLGVHWTDSDPALRAGLLLGLTAVCDLSSGSAAGNSTDSAAAHLNSDKDSFVKIEKLKYGVVQNLVSRAKVAHESSSQHKEHDSSSSRQAFMSLSNLGVDSDDSHRLRSTYAMAIPNIWTSLSIMGVSLTDPDVTDGDSSSRGSRQVLLTVPAPILRRLFTLTAVFASDLSLQGLSMLSSSLLSLGVGWSDASRPPKPADERWRKTRMPKLLAREITKRTLQVLEQLPSDADESSTRSFSNILFCVGQLGLRLSSESAVDKRFRSSILAFYERLSAQTTVSNHTKAAQAPGLLPVADGERVRTHSVESLRAALSGFVSIRVDWLDVPRHLKLSIWNVLHAALQRIESTPLTAQSVTELELVASTLCVLGQVGVSWQALLSPDVFLRSRRGRASVATQGLDVGQSDPTPVPTSLLHAFTSTCLNAIQDSGDGHESTSKVAALLLRALYALEFSSVQTTTPDLPNSSDLLALVLEAFNGDPLDQVDMRKFTFVTYHLGKLRSISQTTLKSEPSVEGLQREQLQVKQMVLLTSKLLHLHFDRVSWLMLANVLSGLQGLRVRWTDLPTQFQTACLMRLAHLSVTQTQTDESRPQAVVACVSALATAGMTVEGANSSAVDDHTKAMHALVMRSDGARGALGDELTSLEPLTLYLHNNVHRYVLRQIAETVSSFSALESRLLLRALCSLRWTHRMNKALKLMMLRVVCEDMHTAITRRLANINQPTRTGSAIKDVDEGVFSPFAFTKLCVDVGGISWFDLSLQMRSALLQSAVNYARVCDREDASPDYAQFRSFLRRLESLGADWTSLTAADPSLPFERLLVTETLRHLRVPNLRVSNKGSRRSEDSKSFFDFHVASETLSWAVRMRCRHTDLRRLDSLASAPESDPTLSDALVQTSCDAVLSIPAFAALTAASAQEPLICLHQGDTEGRALRKFDDLLDCLLAAELQWVGLDQGSQRAVLRLVHLAVLLALSDVESHQVNAGTSTGDVASKAIFNKAVQMLLSLRVQWTDLPTRPRNLLSTALARVLQLHQERVIDLIALQNRRAAVVSATDGDAVIENDSKLIALQGSVDALEDMVHVIRLTLCQLNVSIQLVTKELRQFLQ